MGALLAFESVRALRRVGQPLPAHLFVSGCRGPQLPDRSQPRHALNEEDFVAALRVLGDTPTELLENPELLRLLLPMLRADFRVCESYRYTPDMPFGGANHRIRRD